MDHGNNGLKNKEYYAFSYEVFNKEMEVNTTQASRNLQ